MPIYEYKCQSCHHHFELMQKYSDAPAKQCPKCFEDTVIRLLSAPNFQLKGTGWYETDFKNAGKKQPETKKATDSDKSPGDGKTTAESSKTKGDTD